MRFFGRPPMGALAGCHLGCPDCRWSRRRCRRIQLPRRAGQSRHPDAVVARASTRRALRTTAVPNRPSEESLTAIGVPSFSPRRYRTDGYRMLAVTWDADSTRAATVNVRTHTEWRPGPTGLPSHAMDDLGSGAPPNGRLGTEPYWAGDSDGVQVRVDAVGRRAPTDVQVDLIEPGYLSGRRGDHRSTASGHGVR